MKYCIILGNDFEDVEAVTVIDLLRRAKVPLDIYGVDNTVVKSRSNLMYTAEKLFRSEDDISPDQYDGIILPGGPGVRELAENAELLNVIRKFDGARKLIFAICAAPVLLDKAGVLDGRRFTCYPGTRIESGKCEENNVVTDGHLITSRGVGTALEASIHLLERIVSREEADRQAGLVLFK